jgi:hypothetical protein
LKEESREVKGEGRGFPRSAFPEQKCEEGSFQGRRGRSLATTAATAATAAAAEAAVGARVGKEGEEAGEEGDRREARAQRSPEGGAGRPRPNTRLGRRGGGREQSPDEGEKSREESIGWEK